MREDFNLLIANIGFLPKGEHPKLSWSGGVWAGKSPSDASWGHLPVPKTLAGTWPAPR